MRSLPSATGSTPSREGSRGGIANNWRIIQRIRVALQLALIVFLLEILAWLVSIGTS